MSNSYESHEAPAAKDTKEGTIFLNPQKKRLEQIHERRKIVEEIAIEKERRERINQKPKRKDHKLMTKGSAERLSVENDECEYSAQDVDEELVRGVTNEQLRALLIEKNKLDKMLKALTESEKRLKIMFESSSAWFDKYDIIVGGIEEQMRDYDEGREIAAKKIMDEVIPLCERWKNVNKMMAELKEFRSRGIFGLYEKTFGEYCANYAISFLRMVLFASAYLRDLIFPKTAYELALSPSKSCELNTEEVKM